MGEIFSSSGISVAGFVAQLANFLILGFWIIGGLLALRQLRSAQISATAQILWVILILIVPVLGALAFWIVQPHKRQ